MRKIVFPSVALLAVAVSLAVSLALPAVARADVRVDAVAKIQYEVPAGMTATAQGNMVALDEPKKEIAFLVVRTDQADVQKAMADTDKVVAQVLKDVQAVGEPAQIKHNGMDAVQMRATGVYEGKPANVMLLILKTPGGKIVIVVGAVAQAKKDAWAPTFKTFVTSIKPAA